MAKHKIDQTREERIETEIVVDCYNESGDSDCLFGNFCASPVRQQNHRSCVYSSGSLIISNTEEGLAISLIANNRLMPS